MKTGWVPSWESPDEVADQVWDDIVEALVRDVSQTPIVVSGDDVEGFASWQDGLAGVSDHDLIAELALTERTIRQASARQLALVGEFAARQPGTRWIGGLTRGAGGEFVADHLALAMGTSMRCAERRIHEAQNLVGRFPTLHAALACGLVGLPGVRAFLLETAGVTDPDTAAEVEARVIDGLGQPWVSGLGRLSPAQLAELPFADVAPLAGAATPAQITRRTRAAITRLAKDSLRAKPARDRVPEGRAGPRPGTGMSWVGAHLPDDQALAVYQHIDDLAQARRNSGEDPDGPGIDTIRAAVFVDLLMTGTGEQPGAGATSTSSSTQPATRPPHGSAPSPPPPSAGSTSSRSGPEVSSPPPGRRRSPAPGSTPTAGTTTRTTPQPRRNAPSGSATRSACSPAASGPPPSATSTTPSPGPTAPPASATSDPCADTTTGSRPTTPAGP